MNGDTSMKRTIGTLAVLMIAGVLVQPGEATGRASAAEAQVLRTVERIRIVDNAYRPRGITIARGTSIRWVNAGDVLHTSTSNTSLWNSGLLDPGETFSRVFRRAGTFSYTCTLHPAMTGRIVVTT